MEKIVYRVNVERTRRKIRQPIMIGDVVYESVTQACGKLDCSHGLIYLALKRGDFRGMKIKKLPKLKG